MTLSYDTGRGGTSGITRRLPLVTLPVRLVT
jgi:hypothetical protein